MVFRMKTPSFKWSSLRIHRILMKQFVKQSIYFKLRVGTERDKPKEAKGSAEGLLK